MTVVKVVRVLPILMLAVLTISLVMAVGTDDTGWIEKVALVALIAGCVYAAAKVTTLSERFVQTGIEPHPRVRVGSPRESEPTGHLDCVWPDDGPPGIL
jgi:hypothetical protein